ncbi:MAG: hypothetical protein GWN29_04950 [Gammaproteobacteria bacterium]|nr:hypothetical protein [Gammaproteobacteria bacterium]
MAKRGDGDKSEGSGQRISNTTYFADVWALHTMITDRQRNNARNEVDLEAAKVRYLMHQAKLARDSQFASTLFTTSVWSGFSDQAGVTSSPSTNQFIYWDDYSNSDPIDDITDQISALEVTAGVPGADLVAVTNAAVFRALANHPDMLDRIKYTAGVDRPAAVTQQAMAAVLGLDELIVARAVQNSAAEGATATMAALFGDSFLLMYRTPTASDDMPTAASLFSWTEFDGVTPDGAAIFQWYDESRKSTFLEAEQAFDIVATAADLGGIFTGCLA